MNKPCPLCGSSPFTHIYDDAPYTQLISCSKRGCWMAIMYCTVEAWNNRPAEDALRAEVERLRKLCEDVLQSIESGYLASIGSMHNTYEPQIGRECVAIWRAALEEKAQ